MLKVFASIVSLSLLLSVASAAAPELTAEQKALRKELIEKYDKNKDGKLDAEERKAISAEDKEKLEKAGLAKKKKAN